jgi:hypothetical protein
VKTPVKAPTFKQVSDHFFELVAHKAAEPMSPKNRTVYEAAYMSGFVDACLTLRAQLDRGATADDMRLLLAAWLEQTEYQAGILEAKL